MTHVYIFGANGRVVCAPREQVTVTSHDGKAQVFVVDGKSVQSMEMTPNDAALLMRELAGPLPESLAVRAARALGE